MEVLKINVARTAARAKQIRLVTTGMVGASVRFSFGPEWEGLTRTAVFRVEKVTKDVVLTSDATLIPPEVLTAPGSLYIGVYGSNSDGMLAIPTIMVQACVVLPGADPSEDESTDPTLPMWQQLLSLIGPMDELGTDAKDSLVAAINEILRLAGGDISPEVIGEAVKEYLEANPIKETDPTVPAWAKAAKKPTYTADEVGALPDTTEIPVVPTKVSAFENDKQYLTEHQDISGKLDASELPTAINTALAQAKANGEFEGAKGDKGDTGAAGATGQRGTGLLSVTTAPSAYTTAVGGITPKYRMAISTIKTQAGVTEVLLGDTIRYSYYQYPIAYLDASYAYCTTRISVRGATGTAGKTAYAYAQDGGYAGTEAEFAEKLANEYNPNPLYGKKVSFIGDSICAGSSESTSYLGGYGKIIADRNNMAYENLAQAGSTITAETYSSTTGGAKGWICRMVDAMSADADYAIAEGGINDAWQYIDHGTIEIGEISTGYNATLDDTTYYGAFESMLKQLVTKFQGKKIGYIAVPKMMSQYDSNRNAPNFYHIAMECCAKWGVPVCDLNTIIPPTEYIKTLGTEYTADGTHPTYEGYLKYYCDPIEAWMKTLTTGASVSSGAVPSDLDEKYVLKNDISVKKAQLTLGDGTTVLIDVVVASDGTTIQKYTNLVPTSIDTDGSIYNGVGYKDGLRLSSSGVEKTQADSAICGYIPAKAGDVIRLGGLKWWNTAGTNYLCAYDSTFTYIGSVYGHEGLHYGTKIHAAIEYGEDVTTVTLANVTNIAYIRANWRDGVTVIDSTNAGDIILTINEEIT